MTTEFCANSQETASKTTDKNIRYFTRGRINAFVTLLTIIIILSLLVVPIQLLYHMTTTLHTKNSNIIYIGILLISTLIFSAVLSLFTKAKRHEILAASAGWVCILCILRSSFSFGQRMGEIRISDAYINLLLLEFSYCAVLVVFVGNVGNSI